MKYKYICIHSIVNYIYSSDEFISWYDLLNFCITNDLLDYLNGNLVVITNILHEHNDLISKSDC